MVLTGRGKLSRKIKHRGHREHREEDNESQVREEDLWMGATHGDQRKHQSGN